MNNTINQAEESTAKVAFELKNNLLLYVGNYEKSRSQQEEAGYLLEKLEKANRNHSKIIHELWEKYEMMKWGKL
jgi:hypothetical protein